MDSETSQSLKLPKIDFSIQPLEPDTPEWNSVRAQVRKALEEFGCFEAVFEKITPEERRAFFEIGKELFEFPLATKQLNVSEKLYHGYFGERPTLPLYEALGIDEANSLKKVESFVSIFWPQGNLSFCNTIHSFAKKLSELDHVITRMVLESLGVEKYLDEPLFSTSNLLKFMTYKAPQTTESKIGLTPHTDHSFLTILCQNQVEGLEIQTKDGQWISVKPSPDSFTVLLGASLHVWANGRLHLPFHRVMMSGAEARYSAGMFSGPKPGHLVKAPEELANEKYPSLFKPFDVNEFLKFYSTEAGLKAECVLTAYCGV